MPVTHIPQHELDQAKRFAEEAAASRLPKTEMKGGDGIMLRRVPLKLYLNATSVHGYSPHDEEYWRDMERRNPEIKVKYTPRNLKLQITDHKSQIADYRTPGKLTRFGRVTFLKRYD